MAIPRSEEIKDLAIKYSNKQLAQLAQRGEIDPTTAVMAGMMRDRIVKSEMIDDMPTTTVYEDTFAPKQDMAMAPAGLGATPQAAMAPTEAGVAALPVPDEMVADAYAGGGIVAFANGGLTPFQKRLQDEAKAREEFLGKDQSVADLMSYVQGLEGKSKDRAERMFNLRLAQAGLGIAAGQSPYALQNIAAGAAPALQGYGEDVAKQEEAEFGRKKVLAELGGKERAEKAAVFEGAKKSQEAAADRASREAIQRMAVENPSELVVAKALQLPDETLNDAVIRLNNSKRAGEKTTNSILNYSRSAYEAANEKIAKDPTIAKFNRAAQGSTESLEALGTNPATKKPWTAKEAAEKVEELENAYTDKELARVGRMTGIDLKEALSGLRKEEGALNKNKPEPKYSLGINPKTNQQYKEGDEWVDSNGVPIIVKNGQWVYK